MNIYGIYTVYGISVWLLLDSVGRLWQIWKYKQFGNLKLKMRPFCYACPMLGLQKHPKLESIHVAVVTTSLHPYIWQHVWSLSLVWLQANAPPMLSALHSSRLEYVSSLVEVISHVDRQAWDRFWSLAWMQMLGPCVQAIAGLLQVQHKNDYLI